MSTERPAPDPADLFASEERVIHNGQILHEIPGVHTDSPEASPPPQAAKSLPAGIPDIDPDELAAGMAGTISSALAEQPIPVPMEIVNRLLQLKTPRGHKAVFTRFDMLQLFAIWSNKLSQQRIPR